MAIIPSPRYRTVRQDPSKEKKLGRHAALSTKIYVEKIDMLTITACKHIKGEW